MDVVVSLLLLSIAFGGFVLLFLLHLLLFSEMERLSVLEATAKSAKKGMWNKEANDEAKVWLSLKVPPFFLLD